MEMSLIVCSMLLKEAGNGGLDPFDMNLPSSMVQALQALATSDKTGRPDNNLVERIATIMRLHGREYEGGKLTASDIRLLMENEAKSPHEANHWIESGWGDILNGTAIIVGGIAGNAIAGEIGNQNTIINARNLEYSKSAIHAGRTYQGSRQLIQEIIDSSSPNIDPRGSKGLFWNVEGTYNGSSGRYELLISPDGKTIWHFLFKGN